MLSKILKDILIFAATFQCKYCGAWHGGSKHPKICPDCWGKGKR